MNRLLWILQILLAIAFAAAGVLKLFAYALALKWMDWMKDLNRPIIVFIGICELLGAAGLILPMALNISPILTAAAALGIMLVMVLATVFHLSRAEFKECVPTVILGLIAAFVAHGRMML